MEEGKARKLLVDTGRKLLETGLVARTWGNISCRLDEDNIVITPSGLDYTKTREEDIVKLNLSTGEWQGLHKPSGERRIHVAAYRIFPDVNFVIHTHQTYATAIGLAGFERLDMTGEEREKLGGVMRADYGLPGTKKLTEAVNAVLKAGARVVLMANHGVLLCGSSRDEAMDKAMLLEEICKKNVKGSFEATQEAASEKAEVLAKAVKEKFRHAALVKTPAVLVCANRGLPIYAQVDDMAQMIGRKIPVVSDETGRVLKALERRNAVLVPGIGAVVRAETEDDTTALGLLVDKAAVCGIHTAACGVKAEIGIIDTVLMNFVYKRKYSKQKDRG
ncbi:MAG: class II aldolase/adducin family protein [Clostridiaceae bacterium]|nr:class II aldolase/adducin family protein [Clostridiaceae bacterium]